MGHPKRKENPRENQEILNQEIVRTWDAAVLRPYKKKKVRAGLKLRSYENFRWAF